jgi:hypothetical protein
MEVVGPDELNPIGCAEDKFPVAETLGESGF